MAQVSAKPLSPSFEKELYRTLHQLLADLGSAREAERFLSDFLGETEHLVLAKRLAVAVFLDQGQSYEEICRTVKVSSATVASIAEQLDEPGYKVALQNIKADQWAGRFSSKLMRMFKSEA